VKIDKFDGNMYEVDQCERETKGQAEKSKNTIWA
jgi:hypothetical protein